MGTLAVVSSYELNSISKARTFRSIIAAGTSSVDSSRLKLVSALWILDWLSVLPLELKERTISPF